MHRFAPPADDATDLLSAARRAREIAGDEAAAGDESRRDAFVALLYGLSIGFESRAESVEAELPPLAERVDTAATRLAREVLALPFRDAGARVEAVAEALASGDPDPAIAARVHGGAAAAADWLAGDARAFEAGVLQATTGDSLVSTQPLRPRR
jgi:hypothetical protein